MANNCCVTPAPPSVLEGTLLKDATLQGGVIQSDVKIDAPAVPKGTAGGDLGGSYPNPKVVKSTNQVLETPVIKGEITTDSAAKEALVRLFVQAALDDEDLLEALKACIISSINRCDGSSHAVGDMIPTCDEMSAAIKTEISVIGNQLGKLTSLTPTKTEAPSTPTEMYGGRTAVMGAPKGFLAFGKNLVPYY